MCHWHFQETCFNNLPAPGRSFGALIRAIKGGLKINRQKCVSFLRSSINDGFTFSRNWEPDMGAAEHTEQPATQPYFPGLTMLMRNGALQWSWRLLQQTHWPVLSTQNIRRTNNKTKEKCIFKQQQNIAYFVSWYLLNCFESFRFFFFNIKWNKMYTCVTVLLRQSNFVFCFFGTKTFCEVLTFNQWPMFHYAA